MAEMAGLRRVTLLSVFVLLSSFATSCTTSSTSNFNVENWSSEIITCIGELEQQYPGSARAAMWVVCEDKYWSDKQALLSDLCASDPNFSSCGYKE